MGKDYGLAHTGLFDIVGKPIMNGDIVFWDDNSKGEWSRIAEVQYKKPDLHFKVVASPYKGIIGHRFNYGNFIWQDTKKYLEIMPSIDAGLAKAALLRLAQQ